MKNSISFIGAGNVATHLAWALRAAGLQVDGVYSKTDASAMALAEKVGGRFCSGINEVLQTSQVVIVAVPDVVLPSLITSPVPEDVILVHTSGAVEMNVFRSKAAHYGVLYPLQTFSRDIILDLNRVPFCIEASDDESLKVLRQIASSVSDTIVEVDSDRRKILHLAAVFACNFPNSLYAMADEILKSADLSFRLLHPLIQETARKATLDHPWNAQTGPARRNDLSTIRTHEAMLADRESYKEIYTMLSNVIQQHYLAEKNSK